LARKRTTIPSHPNDARVLRSVEALRSAFLELLERKPLDQILIREITDTAGLSYPTFFRRFASKEELLEDIATGEVRNLLALGHAALEQGPYPGSAGPLCRYVHEHRRLWKTLLTGGAAAAMRQEFMRVAREFASTRPRINPWVPFDLAVPFVTSGIFELLAWWMRQPDDYPVENVIQLVDALIVDPSARPRSIVLPAPGG
jgi:AcrR family transcriptional regulator